jgi:signal transduction histidine kinase
MSENILREALHWNERPRIEENMPFYADVPPPRTRTPILVAEIEEDGKISVLVNQLYFLTEEEAEVIVKSAVDSPKSSGILSDKTVRFLKSDDGTRIAMADASMEQGILRELILHSLIIGFGALTVFLLISLFLARWAVGPVELAWKRQRQFVADASHELKTPLTVILSNAEMLSGEGGFSDEKKARRIAHIRAEALRMKTLVEDLLTLAKIDGTAEKKSHHPVDFSFTVMNTLLAFESIIYDARKKLDFDVADNLFVSGDDGHLRQLLGILLDNASKYCPAGGEVRVTLKTADRKNLLLTVRNEGDPIPREALDQIFLRFYRVDSARSAHGGYGLGLSIAEKIVKEHGGRIWAESDVKTGNSFFVSLPMK